MADQPTNYNPSPDIIARRLGDETVIVHLGTNRIYELNSTATRLWELLAEGNHLPAARAQLLAEFEVDEATLDSEIRPALDRLLTEGLLQPGSSD